MLDEIIPLNIGNGQQLLRFQEADANQVHEYNFQQGYQVLAPIYVVSGL